MLQWGAEVLMIRTHTAVTALAVALGLAGCYATGDVEYAATVRVSSPDLVMIQAGVEVIADADDPIFFVDGSYFLFRDGRWLRSNRFNGGFIRVSFTTVPVGLRRIERPQAYAHFRTGIGRSFHAREQHQPTRARPMPHEHEHEHQRFEGRRR